MPTCTSEIFLLAAFHILSFTSGDYVWAGRDGWKWQESKSSRLGSEGSLEDLLVSEGAVRRSVQPLWIEGSGEEGSSGDIDDEDTLEGTGLGDDLDHLVPSLILDPITTTTTDPVEIEDSSPPAPEIPLVVSADFDRVRVEWMPPLDGDISVSDNSDSLKLSWDLPSSWRQADTSTAVLARDGQGAGVVGYQVLYAPSSSWDQSSTRVTVNTKDREFLLSNLERDVRYTLRVSPVFEPSSSREDLKAKPNQSLIFTNRPHPMQVGSHYSSICIHPQSSFFRLSSPWMLLQTHKSFSSRQNFSQKLENLTTSNTALSGNISKVAGAGLRWRFAGLRWTRTLVWCKQKEVNPSCRTWNTFSM